MTTPAEDSVTSAPPQSEAAPAGVVCDPVTGECRLPPRAGTPGGDIDGSLPSSLVPLPKKLRPLSVLEDEEGNKVDPAHVFKGKMVGVYVSASWCPPCKKFSPILSKWAKGHKDEFAVVLVSLDKSEPELREFAAGKGFVRIPFEPDHLRQQAAESFEVQMLPTLVIVNGDTGAIVTGWGRSAVTKNPKGCMKEWKAGRAGVNWLQLIKPW